MSATSHQNTGAGAFATARRGGLTSEEVRMAEALRARDRPVSWQHIATRLGKCEIDIRRVVAERTPEPVKPAAEPVDDGRKNFQWNDQQTALLIQVYGKVDNDTLAAALGINVTALTGKAFRMGLTKRRGHNGKGAA
jgi:hypothetical protein